LSEAAERPEVRSSKKVTKLARVLNVPERLVCDKTGSTRRLESRKDTNNQKIKREVSGEGKGGRTAGAGVDRDEPLLELRKGEVVE